MALVLGIFTGSMTIVYLVTNINTKKRYVGITSLTLHQRRYYHYHAAKYNSQLLFHRALRKYKPEDWLWEIKLITQNDAEAKDCEKMLIEKYQTHYINGYNMTLGGDGLLGYKHTEETKLKISKANMGNKYSLGHKHTQETRLKMGQSQIGRKHSKETKIKMSKSMTGLKRSDTARCNMSKAQTGIKRTSPRPVEITDSNGIKEFPKSLKLWCEQKGYKYHTVYMSIQRTGKYKQYSVTHR